MAKKERKRRKSNSFDSIPPKKVLGTNNSHSTDPVAESTPAAPAAINISQWLHDTSFDEVSLSDSDRVSFDRIDLQVLMEILGCTLDEADSKTFSDLPENEKHNLMLRIIKIMKTKSNGKVDFEL